MGKWILTCYAVDSIALALEAALLGWRAAMGMDYRFTLLCLGLIAIISTHCFYLVWRFFGYAQKVNGELMDIAQRLMEIADPGIKDRGGKQEDGEDNEL